MTARSRSLPIYGPLAFDASGRDHLAVVDADAALPAGFASVETWRIGATHDSIGTCVQALALRLKHVAIGFRLYLLGCEAFLAPLIQVTATFELNAGEIQVAAIEGRRRIICIACRTISIASGDEQVRCPGCGADLELRQHYSKRHGAYLGVTTGRAR